MSGPFTAVDGPQAIRCGPHAEIRVARSKNTHRIRRVGAHVIKRSRAARAESNRRETRTMLRVLLAVMGPLLLVYALVLSDVRRDLSEAEPKPGASMNGTPIVSWKSILVEPKGPPDGTQVTMLGYMMEGLSPIPELARVSGFTLMPDAGTWAHPAHREADEMVEISLFPGAPTLFVNRRLVWVTGRFQRVRSGMHYGEARYALTDAQVREAAEKDLGQWFTR
jgi:hypothetical protein